MPGEKLLHGKDFGIQNRQFLYLHLGLFLPVFLKSEAASQGLDGHIGIVRNQNYWCFESCPVLVKQPENPVVLVLSLHPILGVVHKQNKLAAWRSWNVEFGKLLERGAAFLRLFEVLLLGDLEVKLAGERQNQFDGLARASVSLLISLLQPVQFAQNILGNDQAIVFKGLKR